MLRGAILRSARTFHAQPALRPCYPLKRYISTVPGTEKHEEAKRAARELGDDLQRDWDAKIISYEDLLPKTESPSMDGYLIDVREKEEFEQGSIPSSVNLPLSILANSLHLNEDAFNRQFPFQKPKKDQELIFYCRSGKRSTSASDVAKRNGYTNILNYKGSCTLSVDRYNALSDRTMDSLLHSLETILDDVAVDGYEVEYHSGVLTLQLGEKGTYVINKQPPNKQIWLSSPFSGPKRYDYVESSHSWVYLRDGQSLLDLLNSELGEALQQTVDVKTE
ncbi:Frataxin, mitochondrial [Mycena kentingensis (nom. inval.)]|nr:Frataxin, mitochondrial [Mycena kentingensis (nom. inval.)]